YPERLPYSFRKAFTQTADLQARINGSPQSISGGFMNDRTAVGNPAAALGNTSFCGGLRTNAWRTDESLKLDFPQNWDVATLWPAAPLALTVDEMAEKLNHPFGQPPVAELCRAKTRPLIIVDDLNRPTPAGVVISLLLERFREAGIPAG